MSRQKSFAVVGAGLSGLICSKKLSDAGFKVTVFEKSRGSGGRLSTRRVGEDYAFDHGAQYFTARSDAFKNFVEKLIQAGQVKEWTGTIKVIENGSISNTKDSQKRYVAVPGNSSLVKQMAADLASQIKYNTRVAQLKWTDAKEWSLVDDKGQDLGTYQGVVLTCPAPQTEELLKGVHDEFNSKVKNEVTINPCWSLMLAFKNKQQTDFDGAFVNGNPMSWIARNSSKPGRSDKFDCWVVHGSGEWSNEHLEEDAKEIEQKLLKTFLETVPGVKKDDLVYSTAHRWRYASPQKVLKESYLFDAHKSLGVCGDWCGGPRVEGAFLSGYHLADGIIAQSAQNKL